MLEAALYLALGVAVCSALAGGRTAWIMVPAVGVCIVARTVGVHFAPLIWFGFDIAVMALIGGIHHRISRREQAVMLLFPVAWACYFLPETYRYAGPEIVTTAQLLLTYRHRRVAALAGRLWVRWKDTFRHRHEWTDLERRAPG